MKNTKQKISLKRAMEIAKAYKFDGLPAELDEISISEALVELQGATNKHPASLTLKEALSVIVSENVKQKTIILDERPVRTPDEPPIPADPHLTASWRDTREWK